MKHRACMLFFMVLGLQAGVCRADEPSMAEVVAMLRTTPLHSVEEFLDALPERYFATTTFVVKSRSMQQASWARPRIILHSDAVERDTPRRHVVLAVGGDGQSVEAIEFDDRGGEFDFYRLFFSAAKPTVERNPTRCATCHGAPARPIWDGFGIWPGFLASLSTHTTGAGSVELERAAIAGLRESLATHPRYRRVVDRFDYGGLEAANGRMGLYFNRKVVGLLLGKMRAHAAFPSVRAALVDQTLGEAFVEKLPPEMQEAARERYPGQVASVCRSIRDAAEARIERLISASGPRLERRLVDDWEFSSVEYRARILTVLDLLGMADEAPLSTTTSPRWPLMGADGWYGPSALLFAGFAGDGGAVPPVNAPLDLVHSPANRLVLSKEHDLVTTLVPHRVCGPLSIPLRPIE